MRQLQQRERRLQKAADQDPFYVRAMCPFLSAIPID